MILRNRLSGIDNQSVISSDVFFSAKSIPRAKITPIANPRNKAEIT